MKAPGNDEEPKIPAATRLQYLERRVADLAIVARAEQNREFSVIEQLAHRMKGNGSTFGFPEITELGGKLESAAANQDGAQLNKLTRELHALITQLAQCLRPS